MRAPALLSAAFSAGSLAAKAADPTLQPFQLKPLPLGSIKPQGWLRDQMQLMADGLAGHEHDFYQYVSDSSWTGGTSEYSNLNEGFPYWFNGLVPLAYGIDDARLKDQVLTSAKSVISRQQSDGWIGPETNPELRNFWARTPFFLGLTQLMEADPSQADTILPALRKFVSLMNSMLKDNSTGLAYMPGGQVDPSWGLVRASDLILTLEWLYENNPGDQSSILMDNMQMIADHAWDWGSWWKGDVITQDLDTIDPAVTEKNYPFEHGVNVGQGLKSQAVIYRFKKDKSLLDVTRLGVNRTFTYHGAPSGTVLADERERGLAPYTGSELCTAVETMYSLSYLYQTMGDNSFADRCELAGFNSLPVMLTPDWWAHQYFADPNQPWAKNITENPSYNGNNLATTFGLEPNYPCCTVNHPQGFPKFASASWVQVGDNGLGHALLSPSTVTATLKGDNKVTVECQTDYPFGNLLSYDISSTRDFDFYVRVPAWAGSDSQIQTAGGTSKVNPDPLTGMHKVSLKAGKSQLKFLPTAKVVAEPRANQTVAIHYGALLYALDIAADKTSIPPRTPDGQQPYPDAPLESRDWRMDNSSAWNFAIDPSTIQVKLEYGTGTSEISDLNDPIFQSGGPPNKITVKGCQIDWPLFKNVPGLVPLQDQRKCLGEAVELELIPYGAAKLHMSEFPTVDLSAKS